MPGQPQNFDPMAPVAMPAQPYGDGAPMAMPAAPAYGAPVAMPAAPAMPVGAPAMPAGVPMGQAVAAPAPGAAPVQIRTSSAASAMAARRRAKGTQMVLIGGGVTIALLCVGGAIAYPLLMGSPDEQIAAGTKPPVTAAVTPSNNPGGPGAVKPADQDQGTPFLPGGQVVPPPNPATMPAPTPVPGGSMQPMPTPMAPGPGMANPAETPNPNPPPNPGATPVTTPIPTPTTDTPPGMEGPTPPSPVPGTPGTPAPTPPPTTTTPVPTPPDNPTPPEPTPPAMEQPTRADLLALKKALTTAREALSEQNFAEAEAQIKVAEQHAKTDELRDMVDRLAQVIDMTRQFREAVVAAIQGLEAGEAFQVGSSTQVGVVETFPDKVILRVAGQNRTYRVEDLPPGLAVALADMKLDTSDPVNRVIKGAYLMSGKNIDPDVIQKAKTWWDEAQLGGADTTKLMPFLKDKYDFEKELAALKE